MRYKLSYVLKKNLILYKCVYTNIIKKFFYKILNKKSYMFSRIYFIFAECIVHILRKFSCFNILNYKKIL